MDKPKGDEQAGPLDDPVRGKNGPLIRSTFGVPSGPAALTRSSIKSGSLLPVDEPTLELELSSSDSSEPEVEAAVEDTPPNPKRDKLVEIAEVEAKLAVGLAADLSSKGELRRRLVGAEMVGGTERVGSVNMRRAISRVRRITSCVSAEKLSKFFPEFSHDWNLWAALKARRKGLIFSCQLRVE